VDLITLDENMHQKKLIENYDSLIWTERYTMGDFSLVSGNVEGFMQLLPRGKIVSLRESTVPMIVERHKIIRNKNVGAKIEIVGREFTSILDRRVSIQAVGAALAEWLVVAKIPSDIAHYIIYKICVEGVCDPKDIFPPSMVQFIAPDDYLASTGPNREWSVPRGNLLATVMGYLATEAMADPTTTPPSPKVEAHGIRAMRPDSTGTAIGIQIYKGVDRSDSILFDGTRDLLDDGTYLFSEEGSATDAYVLGPNDAFKMSSGAPEDSPSGLDRRVKLVDGSTSGTASADSLKNEGSRALSEAHVTAMFDGSVNQDLSPYIYGRDYGLGDIVKLVGDYGLEEKARVTEYIRVEDATGNKAYPTLTAISPEME
jgi:hypothetical protein